MVETLNELGKFLEQFSPFDGLTIRAWSLHGNNVSLVNQERSRRVSKDACQREFLELLDLHGAALMAMLRRLCGNCHDAEDVFQETAARVWRSFPTRPKLRNPQAWVMTIGYRAFLNARDRRPRHEDLSDLTDHRHGSPGQMAERSEEHGRVQAAIAGLPEPIREVVVLHYVGGLTLGQTATAMELSTGTVKSRLNTALNKLRSVLE